MIQYARAIQPVVGAALFRGKVVVIYGARQVGKTTLVREVLRRHADAYFWRTYDRAELDYLEEEDGRLVGFECKWTATRSQGPSRRLMHIADAPSARLSERRKARVRV
jgi:AAA domain/Domain of unknown function (DUF4143)